MSANLSQAVKQKSDKLRATIMTRSFLFEGFIHTPRVGKEGRRFSDALNNDRKFLPLTQVSITNRSNGVKDPNEHPLIQIYVDAIEYVKPHFDD